MRNPHFIFLPLLGLALMGQGCLNLPSFTATSTTQHVAEQLINPAATVAVPSSQGFGVLPKIQYPPSRATVTLVQDLPKLSPTITVLRLRTGLPDDTVLKSLTYAMNIPAGVLGTAPQTSEMSLNWSDNQNFKWTYRATLRRLEFYSKSTSGALTIPQLMPYGKVVGLADTFFFTRGFNPQYYRTGLVEPDWYTWWTQAQARNLCMDQGAVDAVHAIASSDALLSGGLPPLVSASSSTCLKPEFPSTSVVRYRSLIDERDVVRADGSYINGAEIVVDAAQGAVISGQISMFYDPERSDYAALSADQVKQLVQQGGLSGASGNITISSFDYVFYWLEDSSRDPHTIYLIPSLLAKGTRSLPGGGSEPFNLVVPLLAQ